MPVNLSIKAVPEHVAEELRQRAERNHRSLQGELMAIITTAIGSLPGDTPPSTPLVPGRGEVVGFDRRGRPIVRKGRRSIEDIAAELRRHTPKPRHDLPRTVDVIRTMRDDR